MFNFFKEKLETPKTIKEKLKEITTKEVVITQANKQSFYHEIVGNTVRIYNRGTGFVMETESNTPLETALELISSYNRGHNGSSY